MRCLRAKRRNTAPAPKIEFAVCKLDAQPFRKKCGWLITIAKLGVWLASISIRFSMRYEAKGLPAEVSRGRSFRKVYREKILKVRA